MHEHRSEGLFFSQINLHDIERGDAISFNSLAEIRQGKLAQDDQRRGVEDREMNSNDQSVDVIEGQATHDHVALLGFGIVGFERPRLSPMSSTL